MVFWGGGGLLPSRAVEGLWALSSKHINRAQHFYIIALKINTLVFIYMDEVTITTRLTRSHTIYPLLVFLFACVPVFGNRSPLFTLILVLSFGSEAYPLEYLTWDFPIPGQHINSSLLVSQTQHNRDLVSRTPGVGLVKHIEFIIWRLHLVG